MDGERFCDPMNNGEGRKQKKQRRIEAMPKMLSYREIDDLILSFSCGGTAAVIHDEKESLEIEDDDSTGPAWLSIQCMEC